MEWGYADRLQTSSKLTVQLQHQFQECQLLMALVLNASHGQGVVHFATRCPISMIRPNRSSRLIDWCEVSPCLLTHSNSRPKFEKSIFSATSSAIKVYQSIIGGLLQKTQRLLVKNSTRGSDMARLSKRTKLPFIDIEADLKVTFS